MYLDLYLENAHNSNSDQQPSLFFLPSPGAAKVQFLGFISRFIAPAKLPKRRTSDVAMQFIRIIIFH